MRTVAVLAFEGISPFHLSAPLLVFGGAGLRPGEGLYRTVVVAETPGLIAAAGGVSLLVEEPLTAMRGADLVVIPSWDPDVGPSPALLDEVRAAHARGARIVGLCLGSFVVARSGVARSRELCTHWSMGERLERENPGHTVRTDVLWSDLGDVVTSAGVAAALDCCLHVVRTEHGSEAAASLARRLVMAPHRDGSQAQFLTRPVAAPDSDDEVSTAMRSALEDLSAPLDLDGWARRAHLSRRTFTRRFRERTGTSPGAWLVQQRLDLARRLLESTDETIEEIARRAGFGGAVTLRHHFRLHLGTTPRAHRRAFAGSSNVR